MRKTLKLLGVISMVVICAAACGTQEPQEETKAVQSGQDEENQNQVKFSVGNASFYQNEIYFEIAAENVVLKENGDDYLGVEILVKNEEQGEGSIYGMTVRTEGDRAIFPYVAILDHEIQQEEISCEVNLIEVSLGKEYNGEKKLKFSAGKDSTVKLYTAETELSCEDGTTIKLKGFEQSEAGLTIRADVTTGDDKGHPAYYVIKCRNQNGKEEDFYYFYESNGEEVYGTLYTEGQDNGEVLEDLESLLTIECYKVVGNGSLEKQAQSEVTVQETTNDNAEFNISADVNHDGTDEDLKVTVNKESTGDFLDFVVMKEDSDEIICEEKGYWQEKKDLAYYLYNDGAESYIIKYWPQMAQGTADYSYTVFYLNESGEAVITDEDEVRFESYNVSKNFDVAQMTAFADRLNVYLDKSIRLFKCDTDTSSVEISSEKNLIKDREEYGFIQDYDIDYSDCNDMSEKLNKYYEYVQKLESASQE